MKINMRKFLAIVLTIIVMMFDTLTVSAIETLNPFTFNGEEISLETISEQNSIVENESEESNIETNAFLSQIVENIDYKFEKLTLDNIPDYMITSVGINDVNADKMPIALATEDAKELNSFTTVNADGTNTLYLFNEPIKYVDGKTSEIRIVWMRGDTISYR